MCQQSLPRGRAADSGSHRHSGYRHVLTEPDQLDRSDKPVPTSWPIPSNSSAMRDRTHLSITGRIMRYSSHALSGCLLLCSAFLAAGAGSADAQDYFGADRYTTSTAGQTGDGNGNWGNPLAGISVEPRTTNWAVVGLRVEEKGDTPCRAEYFSRSVASGSTTSIHWHSSDCNRPQRGDVEIQFGSDTYLYKLQICTNDQANQTRRRFVKGLRGWGRKVVGTGELRDEGAAVTDEQPNCRNNWSDNGVAECPAAQVALGVSVHYRNHNSTGGAIVGFTLHCSTVHWAAEDSEDESAPFLPETGRETTPIPTVTIDATLEPTGDVGNAGATGKLHPKRPTGINGLPRLPGASDANDTVNTGAGVNRPDANRPGARNPGGAGLGADKPPLTRPDTGNSSDTDGTDVQTPNTPGGSSGSDGTPAPSLSWTAPTDWTRASGGQGTIHHRWVGEPDRALTSLIFREQANDAVRVEFVGMNLCTGPPCASSTDHRFELRSGNLTSQQSVWVGEWHYAVALEACISRSGKLKGLKMWGARIRPNGTLAAASQPAEFERPNCRDWGPKIQCGADRVVVGLWLREDANKGFVGLSIKCGRVAMS